VKTPNSTVRAARPRGGFSLTEVIVAMTLLAVVSASLAAMTVQVARGGQAQSIGAQRNAVLLAEASKLQLVPYDSLLPRHGELRTSAKPFPHTRTLLVAGNGDSVRVSVIVSPSVARVRPETLSFTRAATRLGNPFTQ
jgi:prepilin-type N-terminal cleavage/methylation domain-containing protein